MAEHVGPKAMVYVVVVVVGALYLAMVIRHHFQPGLVSNPHHLISTWSEAAPLASPRASRLTWLPELPPV